jgi:hypothetical protein
MAGTVISNWRLDLMTTALLHRPAARRHKAALVGNGLAIAENHLETHAVSIPEPVGRLPRQGDGRVHALGAGAATWRRTDLAWRTALIGDRYLLCSDGLSAIVGRPALQNGTEHACRST